MLAELARFTGGRCLFGGTKLEVGESVAKRVVARMSEVLVLECHGRSGCSEASGVEVARGYRSPVLSHQRITV